MDRIRVGTLQRREIKPWRGLRRGCFDYNEVPTSSCHTFCWKARHRFDVPFFWPPAAPFAALEIAAPSDVPSLPSAAAVAERSSSLVVRCEHGSDPQFFDHRPHRPWQIDPRRSPDPALRRPLRPRDGSAGARLDGHRARARHHHQGADGGARVRRSRRPHLPAEPDRHARATSTSPTRSAGRCRRAKARSWSSMRARASRRRPSPTATPRSTSASRSSRSSTRWTCPRPTPIGHGPRSRT